MSTTATTTTQTKDDLSALRAQLGTLKQQRQQATTELQGWAGELGGRKSTQALGEIDRLTGFIARLDKDIKRQQVDVDVLTETLKTDAERAAEQEAIALKQQQTARRAELRSQLGSLIAAFNLTSAQLREQWQDIRAMLNEECSIADALGVRADCLLGAHSLAWGIEFFTMGANQYDNFKLDSEMVGLFQPMPDEQPL